MAVAMMTSEELRVLMLPWVGVLRDYVDVGEWHSTWNTHGDRVVWVQMVSDAPRGIEPRAFDAMELLTLLGEIDYAAWRMALAVAWPRQATTWIEAANGHALRFGWKLVFQSSSVNDAASMDIAKWCDRIVVDGAARTCSREYLRARNVLESQYKQLEMATERALRRPVARDQLQIPVQLVMKEGPLETRLLKLLQVAALQHARETSPVRLFQDDPWEPLMRITDVDTGATNQHVSPKAFLHAVQLAAFDIQLITLSLDHLNVSADTAMLYTTGLQYLLATKGVNAVGKPSTGAVDSVVVPPAMQRQTVDAIYSAIAASATTRNVSINKPPRLVETQSEGVTKMSADDRDHLWKWVAVSLFSSQPSNRVAHVDIDVDDLSQRDVAAMESALSQEYPLDAVRTHGSVAGTSSGDEYATAAQFRLLPPDTQASQGVEATVSFGLQKVLVLSRLPDGWMVVMLPGWGTAWLHEKDMEGEIHRRIDKSEDGSVQSLRLSNVTSASAVAVVSLLRLVGRNVRTLTLSAIKVDEPLDDWVRSILQVCPCLEELKIVNGGSLTTLDTVADCYEQGYCCLRRLSLSETSIADAARVSGFFYTLADATHPMSRQLREFSLTYRSRDPLPGVTEAVHATLKANATLERLNMNVRFQPHAPADQLIQRHAFSAYETPIAVRLLPLSLRNKAALLSVMGSRQHEQDPSRSSSAVHQFDSRVVSLIFQFAAQCRKRSVNVHLWNLRMPGSIMVVESD